MQEKVVEPLVCVHSLRRWINYQLNVPRFPRDYIETRAACSNQDRIFEATKKPIDILKGVTSLVGVPLVKEVLDVGLSYDDNDLRG